MKTVFLTLILHLKEAEVCQIDGRQRSSLQPQRPLLRPLQRHFSFFVFLSIFGSFLRSNGRAGLTGHFRHLFSAFLAWVDVANGAAVAVVVAVDAVAWASVVAIGVVVVAEQRL